MGERHGVWGTSVLAATVAVVLALAWASPAWAKGGTFDAPRNFDAGDAPVNVAAADLDRDGLADLAIANGISGDVSVLLNDGAGGFDAQRRFPAGDGSQSVAVADLNNDGLADLATANYQSDDVSVLLGDGTGGFDAPRRFPAGDGPASVAAADLDGDGLADLATANADSGDVSVLLNDGAGGFDAPISLPAGAFPFNVKAADLNDDGLADLVTANAESNDVSVLFNEGAGTFAAQQRFAVGSGPQSVAAADLNDDGLADLATANNFSADVSVLLNDGAGGFDTQQRFPTGAGTVPFGVAAANLNDDGLADLVTANGESDDVSVLLGDGAGGFDAQRRFPAGDTPVSVAASDLDGDGLADLATANVFSNDVSVLFNEACDTVGSGGPLVVNTTSDEVAPDECTTLREAIIHANATPNTGGPDTISFAIPQNDPGRNGTTGVFTIRPASGLPGITEAVTIDGYTQGSATTNADDDATPNTLARGSDARLLIELSGQDAGGADGLTINAANSTVRGLAINRFNNRGIVISTEAADDNTVSGNHIGTDAAGTGDLGNGLPGVFVFLGADGNTVGGDEPAERNVISANGIEGVRLEGGGTTGNTISGNYVGTDASGTGDLGNSGTGVLVHDGVTGNVVGTDGDGVADGAERNVISGNDGRGVQLEDEGTTGNTVAGNLIGTDASGDNGLGNDQSGVLVQRGPDGNTVGGTGPEEGNVISGNGQHGVAVGFGDTRDNDVLGNRIGTDASGTAAIPNNFWGVILNEGATENRIGGAQEGAGNLISANTTGGVLLTDDAPNNTVQGNLVGTTASGDGALGNRNVGVRVEGSDNRIGGTEPGAVNTIAHNAGNGITIANAAATGNTISRNSISSNAALGIDLGTSGVTPNDAADADAGANGLQNFPVVARARPGSLSVEGSLASKQGASYGIEVFSNDSCDPSGNGEGQTFVGAFEATADTDGEADFQETFDGDFSGRSITATATDLATGDTSEFSRCREVNGPPAIRDDAATTREDTPAVIDVLANDSDPDGADALTVRSVTRPAHGTAEVISGSGPDAGKVRYTPAPGYKGPDSFTYTACDSKAEPECGEATVRITVTAPPPAPPANRAPLAADDSYSVGEGRTLSVRAPGVLRNDRDPEGSSLRASVASRPGHGSLTLRADGSFTYKPKASFSGRDSFSYRATDASGDSNTATVRMTVRKVPEPPPPGQGPRCTIRGTGGGDELVGTPRRDVICALGGDDEVEGLGGDDVILGGAGDDDLNGGRGDDTLEGGPGKDALAGGPGRDRTNGGPGQDTARP